MAQIVVSLLANDQLSPALRSSITQISGWNSVVQGMHTPDFKKTKAEFATFNQHLSGLMRERRDILERGSKDWQRGQMTTSDRELRQQAQQLADHKKINDQILASRTAGLGSTNGMAGVAALPSRTRQQVDKEEHKIVMAQLNEQRQLKDQMWKDESFRVAQSHRQQVDSVGVLKRKTFEQWQTPSGGGPGGGSGPGVPLARTTEELDRLSASTMKFQMAGMQAAFAVDDFIAGFQTGGISGGLRGAANNISMIGMQLGGLKGLLIGIGITATASLAVKVWEQWTGGAKHAKDTVKGVSSEIERLTGLMNSLPTIDTTRRKSKAELHDDAIGLAKDEGPDSLDKRLKDIDFESRQRMNNKRQLELTASQAKSAYSDEKKSLDEAIASRPRVESGNRIAPTLFQTLTFQQGDERINDPLKERIKSLEELRRIAVKSAKALKDNKDRLDDLGVSRRGIVSAVPISEKRLVDEGIKEADAERKRQDSLERKVQAELRRGDNKRGSKLNQQDRLDAMVTGENDAAQGILIEMKDRLDLARQITDEEKRGLLIAGIKESALGKLAKEEADQLPKESNQFRLAGTVTKGSVDAYRTIQTATAEGRSSPTVKHLSAIEKLGEKQVDELKKIVEHVSKEPVEIVGAN